MKSRTKAILSIAEAILEKRKEIEVITAEIRSLEDSLTETIGSDDAKVTRAEVKRPRNNVKTTKYERTIEFIRNSSEPIGPKGLIQEVGVSENSVFQFLKRGLGEKKIKKVGRGLYAGR